MKNIITYINLILKGAGMGAANVIPGVSGGTIALITGIFEKLINSIKSFDTTAIKLLLSGKFKAFSQHVNFWFLVCVFGGAILSVFSLAKLLQFLFENYELQVYAFFFGLILASVYFVGKTIQKWNISVIITFAIGTVIAVILSVLNPAAENEGLVYLLICGVVAICSMILPGLSGSFVLLLMGNYELVMINAVADLNLKILIPVAIGAVGGLVAFSHLLSWVYKKYRDQTIAILTGFILGSLSILWPWKTPIINEELSAIKGEDVIEGYTRFIPESLNAEVLIAIGLIVAGIVSIWLVEKLAETK
jgi:putative membrane protein